MTFEDPANFQNSLADGVPMLAKRLATRDWFPSSSSNASHKNLPMPHRVPPTQTLVRSRCPHPALAGAVSGATSYRRFHQPIRARSLALANHARPVGRLDDRHYNMCRVCVTEILVGRMKSAFGFGTRRPNVCVISAADVCRWTASHVAQMGAISRRAKTAIDMSLYSGGVRVWLARAGCTRSGRVGDTG